ncbi:response regulator transcription factor [Methylomarinum sp. Ch1-1]|uniref:Response regulator transcription factor n=1 Tax=Methylomarinum roseum TaxID=3067653 RepID=A0AAU7NRA0_9GAMM|nr:response regulator transcription factor [Methylomarinum sp. Ch1-1]MDP4520897.1 response regulator transcription factor [Methylomarinum sp. Ch1-1]
MTNEIKVLLVDDHAVVRAGFKMLLSAVAGMDVCGEAERGEQAIQLYQDLQPDIVVMDLSMPGIGGLETIRRLLQRYDHINILVFSVHHEQVYVNRALSAGAKGYITKNSAPEILPEAIENIVQGQRYIEVGLLKESSGQDYQAIVDAFSAREFDVFRLLAKGLTVQKIAGELCLGYKTVANYATQIKKKLQAESIAELPQIAQALGINVMPE